MSHKKMVDIEGAKLKGILIGMGGGTSRLISNEIGRSNNYLDQACRENRIPKEVVLLLNRMYGIKPDRYVAECDYKTEIDYEKLYETIFSAFRDALNS